MSKTEDTILNAIINQKIDIALNHNRPQQIAYRQWQEVSQYQFWHYMAGWITLRVLRH